MADNEEAIQRLIEEAAEGVFGPPQNTPIPEPVPKPIQAEFVQAEQNLMWLAEHGRLHVVALLLASLRRETEFQESH